MSTEYPHVTQFLQTIFCFSILFLIGQRFIMTCKGQDQKYLQHRFKQLEQQINWQKKHQKHPAPQIQPSPQNQAQGPTQKLQQTAPQQPQQPTLKTSLTEYQNDQTARKMSYQEQLQEKVHEKRRSLTDLVKEEQGSNKKEVEIKEIRDSVQPSIDSRQDQNRNRGITNELDRSNIMNQNVRYPSVQIPANNVDINEQFRNQVRSEMKLQIFTLIDTVFDEHLSVLMSILVLGILTQSTYITSMISLFGYVITHLLLKLKQSIEKLDNQPQSKSKLSPFYPLLPKLWVFVLFINYWAVTQFSIS